MKNSLKRVAALLLAFLLMLQSGIVSPKLLTEIFAEDNLQESQEVVEETGEPVQAETTVPVPFKGDDPEPDGQQSATPVEPGSQEGEGQEQQPSEEDGQLEREGQEGSMRGVDDPYWTITFYNRDAEVYATVDVEKGQAIGDQLPDTIYREDYYSYWAVGELVQGGQGQEISVLGPRVGSTWVPEADTIVVPDFDKITWKVSFYASAEAIDNGDDPLYTRTVNADTRYKLNNIPTVPNKQNYSGKWVYADGDFNNSVVMSANTNVWAEYTKVKFDVVFKVDNEVYSSSLYNSGDTLTFPADPVVEGRDFVGWYTENGDEASSGILVTEDMTLVARFTDQYSVR